MMVCDVYEKPDTVTNTVPYVAHTKPKEMNKKSYHKLVLNTFHMIKYDHKRKEELGL